MKNIKILEIYWEDEEGVLLLNVPNNMLVKKIYKKIYGKIGQKLSEVGNLIQRRRFPHFMNDMGWTHIFPAKDLIKHNIRSNEYQCPCGPRIDTIKRVVLHEPLDPNIEKFKNNEISLNRDWILVEPE